MTSGQNKKRKHGRRTEETRSLWGFLFRKDAPVDDINRITFFEERSGKDPDMDAAMMDGTQEPRNFLQELWHRFNFWSLLAFALFLAFASILAMAVCYMWVPQDLKDIAGYADKAPSRDLNALIRNANGSQVSFTEAELNRYLRETCRMKQTGFFSIFAHAQGVAVRIHDGYVELIIDRVVGVNMHQTTAVNITFIQEIENGRPVLKVDLEGGDPIIGGLPKGGRIGSLSVSKRHIQVLKPALETLRDCYPEIMANISAYGYLPIFTEGKNGQESRVTLVPFTPNTLDK